MKAGEEESVAAVADLSSRGEGHPVRRWECSGREWLNHSLLEKTLDAGRIMYSPGESAAAFQAAVTEFKPDVVHVHNLFPVLSPLRAFHRPTAEHSGRANASATTAGSVPTDFLSACRRHLRALQRGKFFCRPCASDATTAAFCQHSPWLLRWLFTALGARRSAVSTASSRQAGSCATSMLKPDGRPIAWT